MPDWRGQQASMAGRTARLLWRVGRPAVLREARVPGGRSAIYALMAIRGSPADKREALGTQRYRFGQEME